MPSVLKFGGAALADGQAIRLSVQRVNEWTAAASLGEPKPIVVVSALLGVTDGLLEVSQRAARGPGSERASQDLAAETVRVRHRSVLAQLGLASELLDRHWRDLRMLLGGISKRGRLDPPDRDLVLSYGERMSARIFAAALNEAGLEATPVDAWDLGLVTDSNHGQARPVEGTGEAIREALAAVPGIAVVTGFLAKDSGGHLTTLGRNGSDLTASLLAEAVSAEELIFFKDVPGVQSADPRTITDSHTLPLVTYAEAAELAFHGAQLLHPASVAPAIRAGVPVRLMPLDSEGKGTQLVPHLKRKKPVALAWVSGAVRVAYSFLRPEIRAADMGRAFADLENACMTPTLVSVDGAGLTAFAPPGNGVPGLAAEVEHGFATLALIGHGIGGNQTVLHGALESLRRTGIQPRAAQLGASEHSVVLALGEGELAAARAVLHSASVARPDAVFEGVLPRGPSGG